MNIATGQTRTRIEIPEELKGINRLTKDKIEAIFSKYSTVSIEELEVLMKDNKLPVIDHILMAVAHKAFKFGDEKRLAFIVERLAGKPSQRVDIHVHNKFDALTLDDRIKTLFVAMERLIYAYSVASGKSKERIWSDLKAISTESKVVEEMESEGAHA